VPLVFTLLSTSQQLALQRERPLPLAIVSSSTDPFTRSAPHSKRFGYTAHPP
jgi:hypothetical protein